MRSRRNPIAGALATEAKTNETNMTGAAEAMPAEKYGYKPTPDQSSFGQLIFHAADANFRLCSMMSGDKAPEATIKADGAKQALIDQMKESFAYCYKAFDKVDASKLGTQVKFGNRDVPIAWVAAPHGARLGRSLQPGRDDAAAQRHHAALSSPPAALIRRRPLG